MVIILEAKGFCELIQTKNHSILMLINLKNHPFFDFHMPPNTTPNLKAHFSEIKSCKDCLIPTHINLITDINSLNEN